MTDGSYTQVASETYPGKVYWGSGDHSAVTTSQSGVFISKWNEYPLMRHAKNYSPYGSSNLKYYKSSLTYSVSSTLLCGGNTATVTANYMPPDGSWVCSNNLTIISTSGNTVTVQASSYYDGLTWIGIKQYGEVLKKAEIWVGASNGSINGPDYVSGNASFCAEYHELSNPNYIYWMLFGGSGSVYGANYNCSTINFNEHGTYTVVLQVSNACGNIYTQKDVYSSYKGSPSSPFAYPNPVNDILTVDIEAYAQQFVSGDQRISPAFDIRLYDSYGIMVRQATSKGSNVEFHVSNLPNGIYFLHINDDINNKPEKQIIVVQH